MTPAIALLLSPPPGLKGCLFAAILRDTRGAGLSDAERRNFFPASPFVAVTQIMFGELRLLIDHEDWAKGGRGAPLPASFVMAPQDRPIVSWSPGDLLALTVVFYPEAWALLQARCDPAALLAQACRGHCDAQAAWTAFCAELEPFWRSAFAPVWPPSDREGSVTIADWAQVLLIRAASAGPGRGLRSLERRLRRWGGPTRRALAFFCGVERAHLVAMRAQGLSLAEVALEAGFADQSHMGRALRRATGLSPAQIKASVARDESFWCYRLLGARF